MVVPAEGDGAGVGPSLSTPRRLEEDTFLTEACNPDSVCVAADGYALKGRDLSILCNLRPHLPNVLTFAMDTCSHIMKT